MPILFMMPNWKDGFLGWMERIITAVAPEISMIVVNDTGGQEYWQNKIPAQSLKPSKKEVRILSKVCQHFGLSVTTASSDPEKQLLQLLQKHPDAKIYCQYGTFAAKFMNVWRKTDNPLFIQFNGYDVFFDLRLPDQLEVKRHPEDYLANIKELEARATFIAGSKFLKSQLVNAGMDPDKIPVKYYGVPVPQIGHTHSKDKDVQILHLGRLVDFKSPDRTIKAFEIARSKGLDGRLVLVGDGPLKATCELIRLRSPYRESIQILDPIYGIGAQKIYAESDIFTHHNMTGEITGQAEGFGVSPVEAMAAGLPVVGTRSGGVVETVVDGETGFLNEPGDIEAQADSFLKLAQNPVLRQRMGAAGRKRVAEHFSPDQERNNLIEIMGLN